MTKEEFIEKTSGNIYWISRWDYVKEVLSLIKPNQKVLEIGAYDLRFVDDSTVMDFKPYLENTVIHNATTSPYPFKNKEFDLVIATQVWEHLYENEEAMINPKQKEAFAEVIRISKSAILSFPYMWETDDCHNGIDEAKIKEWTLGIEPKEIIKIGSRHIYYFEF